MLDIILIFALVVLATAFFIWIQTLPDPETLKAQAKANVNEETKGLPGM
jgi:hypothetical protein